MGERNEELIPATSYCSLEANSSESVDNWSTLAISDHVNVPQTLADTNEDTAIFETEPDLLPEDNQSTSAMEPGETFAVPDPSTIPNRKKSIRMSLEQQFAVECRALERGFQTVCDMVKTAYVERFPRCPTPEIVLQEKASYWKISARVKQRQIEESIILFRMHFRRSKDISIDQQPSLYYAKIPNWDLPPHM
uniref:Uncharacterized protein n=1 Tax=Spongospora subterranea TaxID=70186 RepID=A0A0H5RFH3_9EUKA|eukprot:CRZ12282.1 hypothetical protein [Spongospora subterranea]